MAMILEILRFVKSHWTSLPYPTHKFTGQVIIVTGSNTGLGLEAARHFVRLDAAKVILAVRTLSKGEEAKRSIEATEKRLGIVEVWELDLASHASVKHFAARAQSLDRLDVMVQNAGMFAFEFSMAEEDETTITVNVVSQFLLGLLLLPKLRETAVEVDKDSVLTFTGSFVHWLTTFPQRKEEKIFEALAKREGARIMDRYNVSKLIELLCTRELAAEVTKSGKPGKVIISLVNPGSVRTEIMRHAGYWASLYIAAVQSVLSRSAEEGSRTLVIAAEGGAETHGAYLDDCKVGRVSPFVDSDNGAKTQKQVWAELKEKLERIQPGITQNI